MADEKRPRRRRLRSSTVALGSMGVLAAALTSCGSEPDKRCVDRDSYDLLTGYKVVSDQQCTGTSTGTGTSPRASAAWYYDPDVDGRYADDGTFSRSEAVDRDGFGCSGSGSGGG
ncbi:MULTISPECIES: hypothetical protein [Streptomyces]|nr:MULTISPECIES: hypothetical protein [Streptomyces]QIB48810.1 hypothetical protein G3H79_13850 [Streptomyces aureoverticillatus]